AERQQVALLRQAVARRVAQAAPGEPAYIPNRRMNPVNYFTPMEVFPGNAVDGTAVRFVDAQPERVAAARARAGTRTAELLVTREESGIGAAGAAAGPGGG
ncbi:MAG TPA: hypothetical protein VL049_16105, partial [Candidatus Dormibacteraeota bacterium]|nr:hypothetical protein [Candidatus Dormibacteraeota bacterium]